MTRLLFLALLLLVFNDGEADFVECPYCDRRFVLAAGLTEGPEDERLAPGVYEGPHGH